MFPWQTKSTLITVSLRIIVVGGSIAYFALAVERFSLVSALRDSLRQYQLGPPEALCGADVPFPFRDRQFGFENHHILRPADFHCFPHNVRRVFAHTVKFPHPSHIARGETIDARVCALQMLRHGHGSAFFRAFGDQASDFPVQLHLRQRGSHSAVNGREQFTVVDCFPDVHWLPLSGAVRLMIEVDNRGRRAAIAHMIMPLQWSISC